MENNLALGVENEGGFDGKGQTISDNDGRFPPDICFDDSIKCPNLEYFTFVRRRLYLTSDQGGHTSGRRTSGKRNALTKIVLNL